MNRETEFELTSRTKPEVMVNSLALFTEPPPQRNVLEIEPTGNPERRVNSFCELRIARREP